MLTTPVLFLVFNRPEVTARVFKEIRKARPKLLYVASDGPRHDIEGEEDRVVFVREIITSGIDWDCELRTLFQSENLGCKRAVSGAIDWFFDNEEEGIVLEDDCLPDESFFPFCQELLKKFRYDDRVMAISGNNFQNGKSRTKYSYYFSRYPHCWGWATWKRSWALWDGQLSTWPELKSSQFFNSIEKRNSASSSYWNKIFDAVKAGKIDSWNYPWIYTCWTQSGLTVLPNTNLVSNIGFGEDSTHTKNKTDKQSKLSTGKMLFPLNHPTYMIRNADADSYFEQLILGINGVYKTDDRGKSFIQKFKSFMQKLLEFSLSGK